MSLDQAAISSLQITNHFNESCFQPFEAIPDDVFLLLLDHLTPFERCLALSINKTWNSIILECTSWWQELIIPEHLPVSTALWILQTFNKRSKFTLKSVVWQPKVRYDEDLDEIFDELKKSSKSMKLLFMNSNFNSRTARMARDSLSNLNTLFSSDCSPIEPAVSQMWQVRKEFGINDQADEKGLQCFQTANLHMLFDEELEWLATLKVIIIGYPPSWEKVDLSSAIGEGKTSRDLLVELSNVDSRLRRLKERIEEGSEEMWVELRRKMQARDERDKRKEEARKKIRGFQERKAEKARLRELKEKRDQEWAIRVMMWSC